MIKRLSTWYESCHHCLFSLVSLAGSYGQEDIPTSLVIAMSKFNSHDVAPFLQRVLRSCTEERAQVFAAWGLARLGEQEAIEYLVQKLDEPDSSSESRRAAQALSDLYGWNLELTAKSPQRAKKLWHSQMNSGKGEYQLR